MIRPLNLKKVFCWVQEGTKLDDGRVMRSHGLAMGEDGVMLALCKQSTAPSIMRVLSQMTQLYDEHFGIGQWELIFVASADVQDVGVNLDFEAALGKNKLLAQQAGIDI